MITYLRCNDISFSYQSFSNRILHLKEMRRKDVEFDFNTKVLHNVDFELGAGEIVSVLGRNGSGKSTLLKLLSGVYEPQTGSIERLGTIVPLIELGAAFHSDLSGLENAKMFATLVRMRNSATNDYFQRIQERSQLEKRFHYPLRTYSSGMTARLAFSCAYELFGDILVIDEVLSVGDNEFRLGAQSAIKLFAENGRSVILVSHDLEITRKLATRAVVLEEGTLHEFSNVSQALAFHNR